MRGQAVPTWIYVVGVMGFVAILLVSGATTIGNIRLPLLDRAATGDVEEVGTRLAESADRCWSRADQGASSAALDCTTIRVEPDADIAREDVAGFLEELPAERFEMETLQEGTQATVRVSYDPVDRVIRISAARVCDPSRGDTCQLSQCRCAQDEVCFPGYDADGDGTPDTDDIGCTSAFEVRPQGDPCDSPWCS